MDFSIKKKMIPDQLPGVPQEFLHVLSENPHTQKRRPKSPSLLGVLIN
jgi:hypothetical protein